MNAAKVKLASWDKTHFCDTSNVSPKVGEQVVIKTDLGNEIGEVIGFEEIDVEKFGGEGNELKQILRQATLIDLEKLPDAAKKDKMLEDCREIVKKYNLPMKLVDMHLSYDGSRLTFAFIADGRIDFRELVKDLTRHFNRTIRLQQIGIRDEAALSGDCGHCGRQLCCRSHLREFVSITSEMAEAQQCEHRGSERISGICGRLMCCLAYEESGYIDLAKDFPRIGTSVNVDGKRGEVVGWKLLKRAVDVKFADEDGRGFTVAEVDLDRNKKNT
jgi:cell fate regulator YaaT (PSP1 superfamily)